MDTHGLWVDRTCKPLATWVVLRFESFTAKFGVVSWLCTPFHAMACHQHVQKHENVSLSFQYPTCLDKSIFGSLRFFFIKKSTVWSFHFRIFSHWQLPEQHGCPGTLCAGPQLGRRLVCDPRSWENRVKILEIRGMTPHQKCFYHVSLREKYDKVRFLFDFYDTKDISWCWWDAGIDMLIHIHIHTRCTISYNYHV